MNSLRFSLLLISAMTMMSAPSFAGAADGAKGLVAHKAVYDIDLVATHSGSQILNISGDMTYEWKPSCDAWVTDHRFKLFYEYADSPGMRIASDFTTYEKFDGSDFHFSSRRHRDGEMYQEIRGSADSHAGKAGKAVFSMPTGVKYDLVSGTKFPMGHTLEVIKRAESGNKFYSAQVFDGSDEEGPIEINTFIGNTVSSDERAKGAKIDSSLLDGRAWSMRMAVFPAKDQEEESDYEMQMVFHENGIISDMIIEYDDFSVKQKLISLEKITADPCGAPSKDAPKKP